MLSRREYYVGVAILTTAIMLHAAVPRYEWRAVPDRPMMMIRIDRWFGRAQMGFINQARPWHTLSTVTPRPSAIAQATR